MPEFFQIKIPELFSEKFYENVKKNKNIMSQG